MKQRKQAASQAASEAAAELARRKARKMTAAERSAHASRMAKIGWRKRKKAKRQTQQQEAK